MIRIIRLLSRHVILSDQHGSPLYSAIADFARLAIARLELASPRPKRYDEQMRAATVFDQALQQLAAHGSQLYRNVEDALSLQDLETNEWAYLRSLADGSRAHYISFLKASRLEDWSYSQLADVALLKLLDRAALLLERRFLEHAAYVLIDAGKADAIA